LPSHAPVRETSKLKSRCQGRQNHPNFGHFVVISHRDKHAFSVPAGQIEIAYSTGVSLSASLNSGNSHAHSPTTISVPAPPRITAGTVPNQCAVNPDSNSPSSFDAPMKIMSTAFTRPRTASGVAICTRVPRTTTLTISEAPTNTSDISESTRLREIPNTIVNTPNPATQNNMSLPTRLRSGL